jgi:hypothetical protein
MLLDLDEIKYPIFKKNKKMGKLRWQLAMPLRLYRDNEVKLSGGLKVLKRIEKKIEIIFTYISPLINKKQKISY